MSFVAKFKVDKVAKGKDESGATVTLSAIADNHPAERKLFAKEASGTITLKGVDAGHFPEGAEFDLILKKS